MGKDKPDIDCLLEEIKNLKSQVRHLERELKKKGQPSVSKGQKKRQDALIEEEIEDRTPKCDKCGKGSIKIVDLGVRTIETCSLECGFRKVTKK